MKYSLHHNNQDCIIQLRSTQGVIDFGEILIQEFALDPCGVLLKDFVERKE